MSSGIKLYYDFLSQPSRALYILFKLNKIPFDDQPVALRTGAHLTPEFKEINRFQKVPCIVDNGFKLSESCTILRYLSAKNIISDKWYPNELSARTRTDEYLSWQHNNTRMACAMYFQLKWLRPLMTGKESNPKMLEQSKKTMENVLDLIENLWLENGKFLTGNSITAADVFGACEIEQTRMAGYDATEGRPKLKAWLNAVREESNPFYDEAHKILNKVVKSQSKL